MLRNCSRVSFSADFSIYQNPSDLPAKVVGRRKKKKKSQPTTLVTLLPWGQDMADKTMRDVKKMSSIPIRHCKYGKVYTSLTERVK